MMKRCGWAKVFIMFVWCLIWRDYKHVCQLLTHPFLCVWSYVYGKKWKPDSIMSSPAARTSLVTNNRRITWKHGIWSRYATSDKRYHLQTSSADLLSRFQCSTAHRTLLNLLFIAAHCWKKLQRLHCIIKAM